MSRTSDGLPLASLRSFDFGSDDSNIRPGVLYRRLNRVITDCDLADDTVSRVEPAFGSTLMLRQVGGRLARSARRRVLVLNVVSYDLQVVNVPSERLDAGHLVPPPSLEKRTYDIQFPGIERH